MHLRKVGLTFPSVFSLTNYYLKSRVSLIHVVSDYSKGFGGKYGVEKEKVDKAALGYDYKGEIEKHQSQKGEFMM